MKTALAAAFCAGMSLVPALAAADRPPIQRVEPLLHGGPFGGRVLSLAADPNDADVLYAGTDAGLFRSADGGTSWSLTPVGREYLSPDSVLFGDSVESVTVSPADSSVVLAMIRTFDRGQLFTQDATVRNLFRSEDSGRTWSLVLTAQLLAGPIEVAVSGSLVYVGTSFPSDQALRSEDEGLTFASLPLVHVQSIAPDPVAPKTVYAAVSTSTYPLLRVEKSTDGGDHWQPTALTGANVSRLHVDPSRPLTLYAEGAEFRRSDDAGAHWTANRWTLGDPIAAFTVGAGDHLYAAVSAGDVYESGDRGDTWSRLSAVPGGALSLAATGSSLIAGAAGKGAFRSDDGGATWRPRSDGLDAAPVDRVVAAPGEPGTAYALAAGFARTTDFGRTWSVDPFAPTASLPAYPAVFSGAAFQGAIAVDPVDARIVYASDAAAGVRRSADGGVSWSATAATPRFVTSIAVSAEAPTKLFMADGQLRKSADGGSSWTLLTDGIPDGAYIVVADPAVPGLLYAATPDLYRSENDGETWKLAITVADLGVIRVFQILPDPAHPGTVYVVGVGLSMSVDRGTSWTPVDAPNPVTAAAIDGHGVLYAGTWTLGPEAMPLPVPGDWFQSADGGATWHAIASVNAGAGPIGFVTAIAADFDGRVYLGTGADGIWQATGRLPATLPSR